MNENNEIKKPKILSIIKWYTVVNSAMNCGLSSFAATLRNDPNKRRAHPMQKRCDALRVELSKNVRSHIAWMKTNRSYPISFKLFLDY